MGVFRAACERCVEEGWHEIISGLNRPYFYGLFYRGWSVDGLLNVNLYSLKEVVVRRGGSTPPRLYGWLMRGFDVHRTDCLRFISMLGIFLCYTCEPGGTLARYLIIGKEHDCNADEPIVEWRTLVKRHAHWNALVMQQEKLAGQKPTTTQAQDILFAGYFLLWDWWSIWVP